MIFFVDKSLCSVKNKQITISVKHWKNIYKKIYRNKMKYDMFKRLKGLLANF